MLFSLVFGFLLVRVSGSWLPRQWWAWTPFHEVGLKSSQIVVVYSYSFCATVALVHYADSSPLKHKGFVADLVFTSLLW